MGREHVNLSLFLTTLSMLLEHFLQKELKFLMDFLNAILF